MLKSDTFVSEVKTKTLNIIIDGNFFEMGNNFNNQHTRLKSATHSRILWNCSMDRGSHPVKKIKKKSVKE